MDKTLSRGTIVTQWCTWTDLQKGLQCAFNVFVKAVEILACCPNHQGSLQVGGGGVAGEA